MRSTPRKFILTVGFVLCVAAAQAHEAANDMVKAATEFLGALSPEQKTKATYALTHAERENWNFVPIARQGLPIKEMTAAQQALSIALLRTGLSHTGVAQVQAIMQLEFVLKELENNRPPGRRDPTLYFVTIFGEPGANQTWGWRFEGHHLSFNFTIVEGKHVFYAPSFLGTNPAEVRQGPRKGERVLAAEDDLGRAFIKSLTPAQQKEAVFAEKGLNDIVTTNKKRVEPLSPEGIAASKLTPAQREKLVELVKVYLNRARPLLAEETFAAITAAGIDQIAFAWAGGFEPGVANYYRIQGPTFLIEFDNAQNNANHIHSTYREFKGDFGHDLLREHYAKEHAKK